MLIAAVAPSALGESRATPSVEDVLRRLPPSRAPVDVDDVPGPDWMGLWWAVDGRGGADARAVARDILGGGSALYALRRDEAGPAAVGRVSLVGRWAGIYCMAVRADARRRGHATDVLRALLVGAADRGARHTWLQVVADNAAALALYEGIGFADFSRYHYRVHPRRGRAGAEVSRPGRLGQRNVATARDELREAMARDLTVPSF